jgi:hypothetical protein
MSIYISAALLCFTKCFTNASINHQSQINPSINQPEGASLVADAALLCFTTA